MACKKTAENIPCPFRILSGGVMKIVASKMIQNVKNTPVYLLLQRCIKLKMERFHTDSEKNSL